MPPDPADDVGPGGDPVAASYLNDVWTLYFHMSEDTDWTLSSYVRLADMSTAEDFWMTQTLVKEHLPENMFFLMREGIYPCWDDPKNMYGCCLSIKVAKTDAVRAWESICARVLGETAVVAADAAAAASEGGAWTSVNGVSISPKKYFCIVKVWLRDTRFSRPQDFALPLWYAGEVLFRSHLDCIKANSEKLTRQGGGGGSSSIKPDRRPGVAEAPGA